MASNANPVGYARSPAGLNEDVLDYGNSDHVKIYCAAIAPLDPKFDVKSGGLLQFLERVCKHVDKFNWKNIILVPDSTGANRNLLTEYGQLTSADVQAHAETYVGRGVHKDHNSAQMFTCLTHSLTEEAKERLKSQSSSYRIGVEELADGPCFLKLIIQKCTTASRSTVATIRNSLSTLPAYMELVKGDIEMFNEHVRVLRDSLLQRGEQCPDLLVNLFTAYRTVQEVDFKDYMKLQYTFYIDGKADFEVEELMEVAANQYKMLVESGTWKTTEASEDRFVALTAEIAALKQVNESYKSKAEENRVKGEKSKKEEKPSPPWKAIAPKEGALQTRNVGSKTFTWCPHHKYWGQHDPASCFKNKKETPESSNVKSSAQNAAVLQLSAIMASLIGNGE